MRVLVVHNRYRSVMPSGENRVVDDEVVMLRDAGLEVETFFRDSDDIEQFSPLQKAALAISPTYNVEAVRDFRRVIDMGGTDVVHLHNPFPLISPWVVRVAKNAGIPVVQSVYNYRHSCPVGSYFRDGKICEACSGKRVPWPAVAHGCYRNSRAHSLAMAVSARAHRSTWELVDRFLAVSPTVAEKLCASGVASDRVTVRCNSIDDPGPPSECGRGFLFAGRLCEEKGLNLLLDAWRRSDLGSTMTLTIAGAGPLQRVVEKAVREDVGMRYVGRVSSDRMRSLYSEAGVVVVPSIWYEGLPTSILEALAHGRPVVTTDIGASGTMVPESCGWRSAARTEDLAATLKAASTGNIAERGRAARERFLATYAPEIALHNLLEVYGAVGAQHAGRGA